MQRYLRYILLPLLTLALLAPAPWNGELAAAPVPRIKTKEQQAGAGSSSVKKAQVKITRPAQQKTAAKKAVRQSNKAATKKTAAASKTSKQKKQQVARTGKTKVGKAKARKQGAVAQSAASVRKSLGGATFGKKKPVVDPADFGSQISAQSVMIIDAKTGHTLYAKEPDTPRQPASTIKIVTALIAVTTLKKHDIVPVSRHAADMPSSKIYLDLNEHYLADDLINAVLLSSANDASVALAERISGSEEAFALLMTRTARLLGAKNTVCRTASGLTAKGQQTTARDLAGLFRRAMRHQDFASRIAKRTSGTAYGKTLQNHNKALWRVEGTDGGKTGYTSVARQTYVGQFTRDGQTIVVALLGSETMWADLKKLVDYGFRQSERKQLAQARQDAGAKGSRSN